MQSALLVLGAAAGLANAWAGNYSMSVGSSAVEYTTVTVDSYTTVCPSATTFSEGTETYTATAHETITVTNCPCTRKTPVASAPYKSTVTAVVTDYTTTCPAATTFTEGTSTYTATAVGFAPKLEICDFKY